jgi:enoyl-[acyl-carrier-protein] reductase (NADH)
MTTDEKMGCKLDGKIALVTGGTSGIGLATAKRFVAEGAYVFITGRREKELASAVKSIGGSVTGVQGDVSQIADLEQLFALIKQEKGRLDIVFANAGTAKYAPLTSESMAQVYPCTLYSRTRFPRSSRPCPRLFELHRGQAQSPATRLQIRPCWARNPAQRL